MVNNTDVETPEFDCKPKLDINCKKKKNFWFSLSSTFSHRPTKDCSIMGLYNMECKNRNLNLSLKQWVSLILQIQQLHCMDWKILRNIS